MLTYIGNFKNNFKVNKLMSDEDLKLFYDSLIKKDFINFNMSKVGQGFYPKEIRDTLLKNIIEKYSLDSKICILNDLSLHLYNNMIDLGYKNISLIFGGFKKEGDKISHIENDNSISIIKSLINSNFKEFKNNSTTANIISVKEFLNMNNNMNNKFDLVIANPPYEIGNAIITETMRHCDEAIVLMPIRTYRNKNLFKHIQNIEIVNPKIFNDSGAAVPDGLAICELSNILNNKQWEEIELEYFDSNFKLVYEWNREHASNASFTENGNVTGTTFDNNPFNIDVDFLASSKIVSPLNGVYFRGFDYAYNVLKDLSLIKDKWLSIICAIRFQTKIEKDNFSNWWYSNKEQKGLTTKLLWGLHKTTAPLLPAIPVIDWSRTDVEYTDEYVLSQMGLKWNENKDGVEKL